jgi:hypothetical protein
MRKKCVSNTLFVESVCNTELKGRYYLKKQLSDEVLSSSELISPGNYVLEHMDGAEPFEFCGDVLDLLPSGRIGPKSQSTASPTPSPKRSASGGAARSGSSAHMPPPPPADAFGPGLKRVHDANPSAAVSRGGSFSRNSRGGSFSRMEHQRDNHCVISKKVDGLKASHFSAFAWWNDVADRRSKLSTEILKTVMVLPGRIDDVRNGLLLNSDLADAFDGGDFSLEHKDGHYYVVVLNPSYDEFDGLMLD